MQFSFGRNNRISHKAVNDASNLMIGERKSHGEDDEVFKEVKNAKKNSFHIYYAPKQFHPSLSKSVFTNGKPKSFTIFKKSNETEKYDITTK